MDAFMFITDLFCLQVAGKPSILACLRVLVTGKSMLQVADMYKIGRQTLDRMFSDFVEIVPVALEAYTQRWHSVKSN